jgi:hypothetical protein
MEKANIRIYFSIILQTRLGSERLVVIALLTYRNNTIRSVHNCTGTLIFGMHFI